MTGIPHVFAEPGKQLKPKRQCQLENLPCWASQCLYNQECGKATIVDSPARSKYFRQRRYEQALGTNPSGKSRGDLIGGELMSAKSGPQPAKSRRFSVVCECGEKFVTNPTLSRHRQRCPSCGEIVPVPPVQAGNVSTATGTASEPHAEGGNQGLKKILLWTGLGSLAVVVVLGVAVFLHFNGKWKQQSRIDAANAEVQEAVKRADGWLKQGSADEGKSVEDRLMSAIAAKDVSGKANADAVLEKVRTRRAELAADSLFDRAKIKLSSKAVPEAVALLNQYVADRHATKIPEARQLLADFDLATSDSAASKTLMAMSEEQFAHFTETGKLDDRKFAHPVLVEIRATALRRNLTADKQRRANQRREEAKIAEANRHKEREEAKLKETEEAKLKEKEAAKLAEAKRQESKRPAPAVDPRAKDKSRAPVVWMHQAGDSTPGEMALHPNGKINDPDGQSSWTLTGKTLVLRWADRRAPGGFWIDNCTVSKDGKTYRGVNQQGVPINGSLRTTELYINLQISALDNFWYPGTGGNPHQITEERRRAVDNLKALGPDAAAAVPRLATSFAVNEGDTYVKQRVLEILGEIGGVRGIDAVGRTLLKPDIDPESKKSAEDALLKLLPAVGKKEALREAVVLVDVFRSGNTRVVPAIEKAWAACGVRSAMTKEINRRVLAEKAIAKADAKRAKEKALEIARTNAYENVRKNNILYTETRVPPGWKVIRTTAGTYVLQKVELPLRPDLGQTGEFNRVPDGWKIVTARDGSPEVIRRSPDDPLFETLAMKKEREYYDELWKHRYDVPNAPSTGGGKIGTMWQQSDAERANRAYQEWERQRYNAQQTLNRGK